MRALEFTRLIEEPVTQQDLDRIKSGKPVDPELEKALADLQPQAEQDPSVFAKAKEIVSKYLKQLQQIAKTESAEVLEDNPTPVVQGGIRSVSSEITQQFDNFEAVVNATMLKLAKDYNLDMNDAKIKTIRDMMLRDIRDISARRVEKGREEGRQEYKSLDPLISAMLDKTGSANPQDIAKAREIFVNDKIDIDKANKFLKQAVSGVMDMKKMISMKTGTLRDLIVGDSDVKEVFDDVIMDFMNWIPGRTAGNIGPGELALVMLGNPAKKGGKGDLDIGDEMYEVKAGGAPQTMTKKGTLGAPKRSGAFFDPGKSGYDARPQVEKLLKDYGFKDFTSYKMRKGKKEPLFNYELTHTRFDNWNNEFDRLGFDLDKRSEVLANVASIIYAPGINAKNPEFPLDQVQSEIKKILSKTKGLLRTADPEQDGERIPANAEILRYFGKLALEKYREEGSSKNNFLFLNKHNLKFGVYKGDEINKVIDDTNSDLKVISGVALSYTDKQSKAAPRFHLK